MMRAPSCHTERSEESLMVWWPGRQGQPEMFRSAQHDRQGSEAGNPKR